MRRQQRMILEVGMPKCGRCESHVNTAPLVDVRTFNLVLGNYRRHYQAKHVQGVS